MKYTEFSPNEQPRARIQELGGRALSSSELLSVALWITDTEASLELSQLIDEYGNMGAIPRDEITSINGLGERYADAVIAISELVRRESTRQAPDKIKIDGPQAAAELVRYEMSQLEQEEMWVVLLDTRCKVIGVERLYKSTMDAAMVRTAEVFKAAIRKNARSVIVCHNHPSGDPNPSPEDVSVTRGLVEAGKLLDIEVMDHLVIGGGTFVSLKQRGLGFQS